MCSDVVSTLRYFTLSIRLVFFFKQKTAYEMRISDWSSDVCSSDLNLLRGRALIAARRLVEVRKRSGKAAKPNKLVGKNAATTPEGLVKAFQEDTERKRMMIRTTEATRNRHTSFVAALGQRSNDETFVSTEKRIVRKKWVSTVSYRLSPYNK